MCFVFQDFGAETRVGVDFSSPLKCGGTVLETGAFDGVTYSNSKFFEDYLGWTSILIEVCCRDSNRICPTTD